MATVNQAIALATGLFGFSRGETMAVIGGLAVMVVAVIFLVKLMK